MRKSVSIAAGVAVAVLLTHGMVSSAMNLDRERPLCSYQGFFQHALFGMNSLWSRAHGWPSMRQCTEAAQQARRNRSLTVAVRLQNRDRQRAVESICSTAHIDEFGRFYAGAVHLVCPLAGFGLFWLVSRRRLGWKVWRPLAVVVLYTAVQATVRLQIPWAGTLVSEIGFAAVIAIMAMCTVGAFEYTDA